MNMGEIGGPYREWIVYDFPKNKRITDGDKWPPSTHSVSFMLDDESKIIINGKEQSLSDGINIGSMSSGGGAGKATFRNIKESNILASIEFDGDFGEPGVAQTNVVVDIVIKDGVITINIYY